MDLREKKTMRSIYNAFLEIRSKKDIEKVTVKELCDRQRLARRPSTFITGISMTFPKPCRRMLSRRYYPM